jgi:hypothetical protein
MENNDVPNGFIKITINDDVTSQVKKIYIYISSNNLVPHHFFFSNNKIRSNTLDPDLLKPSSSYLFDVGAAAINWGKPKKTRQNSQCSRQNFDEFMDILKDALISHYLMNDIFTFYT